MIGASAASLFPTTTTAKSVARKNVRIAAERNVSLEGICAAEAGGHGNKALSLPMREESPAARIKPAKLEARVMIPFRNQKSKLIRAHRLFVLIERRVRHIACLWLRGLRTKPAHMRQAL